MRASAPPSLGGILSCASANETLPEPRASRRAQACTQYNRARPYSYTMHTCSGLRPRSRVSALAFWTISPHELEYELHDLLVELNPGRFLSLHAGQHDDRYAIDLHSIKEEENARLYRAIAWRGPHVVRARATHPYRSSPAGAWWKMACVVGP